MKYDPDRNPLRLFRDWVWGLGRKRYDNKLRVFGPFSYKHHEFGRTFAVNFGDYAFAFELHHG